MQYTCLHYAQHPKAAMTSTTNNIWRSEYPFESRYFSLGNHKLLSSRTRIIETHSKSDQIVLCILAIPTWSFYYSAFLSDLKAIITQLRSTNWGCGLSDKPQTYDYCLSTPHTANLIAFITGLIYDESRL